MSISIREIGQQLISSAMINKIQDIRALFDEHSASVQQFVNATDKVRKSNSLSFLNIIHVLLQVDAESPLLLYYFKLMRSRRCCY